MKTPNPVATVDKQIRKRSLMVAKRLEELARDIRKGKYSELDVTVDTPVERDYATEYAERTGFAHYVHSGDIFIHIKGKFKPRR